MPALIITHFFIPGDLGLWFLIRQISLIVFEYVLQTAGLLGLLALLLDLRFLFCHNTELYLLFGLLINQPRRVSLKLLCNQFSQSVSSLAVDQLFTISFRIQGRLLRYCEAPDLEGVRSLTHYHVDLVRFVSALAAILLAHCGLHSRCHRIIVAIESSKVYLLRVKDVQALANLLVLLHGVVVGWVL